MRSVQLYRNSSVLGPLNRRSPWRQVTTAATARQMEDVPLIPLKVLLGNPLYSSAKVSPDGRYVSYLKPSEDKDVLNVWIRPTAAAAAAGGDGGGDGGGGAGDGVGGDVMVTCDSDRGVRLYTWSEDSRYILYLQDVGGNEDWHLFAQALDKSPARELTPFQGVRADNLITDPRYPHTMFVALNKRDPRYFDMYRLDLETGHLTLEIENPGDVVGWYADAEFIIRGAMTMNPADASKTLRIRGSSSSSGAVSTAWDSSAWYDLITWPQEEEGNMIWFSKDGRSVYVTSSLGSNTNRLQQVATQQHQQDQQQQQRDGEQRSSTSVAAREGEQHVLATLAGSDDCDIGTVLVDVLEKVPQAAGFNYLRNTWKVLDNSLEPDFELLSSYKGPDADMSVESRSTDNSVWLVAFTQDVTPVEYYIYNRFGNAADGSQKLEFLFANRPELGSYKLGRRHPVLLNARDGVTLPSYLTLPPTHNTPKTLMPHTPDEQPSQPLNPDAQPSKPDEQPEQATSPTPAWQSLRGLALPLVLFVHGGPWARDVWGLDTTAQWFANRGYAVLQVNFRASAGYGKTFLHLGDRQWGVGTMQHDLTDAVNWAVHAGIADPKRIAIYGASYGGYACLAGLAFTPELFCCGVDIVGPSHIRTLLQSIPAYWAPAKQLLVNRVGDAEADDALNQRISPLYHASNMRAPLLIAQGANDPRVKKAESDQIYTALSDKGVEVEYYLYTDEGHGFARPPNRLDFCSKVDHFLAKHLQGRAEPPLQLAGSAVVAMHHLDSLDEYQTGAADNNGKTAAAAVGAGAAAAAAGVGAVVAGKRGVLSGDAGRKVGLAVGIPAALLAGGAALVVAVLRRLSPRK